MLRKKFFFQIYRLSESIFISYFFMEGKARINTSRKFLINFFFIMIKNFFSKHPQQRQDLIHKFIHQALFACEA